MATTAKPMRKLQVQLKHDVTREQVMAVMESVFKISGCLTCGIRGIDLNLFGGDPGPDFEGLAKQAGVAGVTGG